MRQGLVGGVDLQVAADDERHAFLRRARDDVRFAVAQERQEGAQPAVDHVEHDLPRLEAAGRQLVEEELGERADLVGPVRTRELAGAGRIEGDHHVRAVLAPQLGAAATAAVTHADTLQLETLHHRSHTADDREPSTVFCS